MDKRQKGEHYVDNKVFLQAMVEWKDKCADVEKDGKEQPPVTNYIGECFFENYNASFLST